jgi:hypothetical protein
MKMTVIADKSGHILGTYRKPAQVPKGYPTFQIHGAPDHTVHELDLPAEFEKIVSAKELHQRLSEHLKSASPKRG